MFTQTPNNCKKCRDTLFAIDLLVGRSSCIYFCYSHILTIHQTSRRIVLQQRYSVAKFDCTNFKQTTMIQEISLNIWNWHSSTKLQSRNELTNNLIKCAHKRTTLATFDDFIYYEFNNVYVQRPINYMNIIKSNRKRNISDSDSNFVLATSIDSFIYNKCTVKRVKL